MSDNPVRRLFDQLEAEPTEIFVSSLRRDLLAGLSDEVSQPFDTVLPAPMSLDRTGEIVPHAVVSPIELSRRRPRSLRVVLVAASIAALVVGAVLSIGGRHPSIKAPNTTEGPTTVPSTAPAAIAPVGYSQQLSADLITPDGYSYRFEGAISLKVAVESNEQSWPVRHDILLLRTISGTFTNTGTGPAPLALAFVQVFLRGDVGTCVYNGATCDPAIIRGLMEPTASVRTLAPGESYQIIEDGGTSRLTVAGTEVAAVLDEVRSSAMVVGVAIVAAGGSADQLASVVFDRAGQRVLTCTKLPIDCMDTARSVLGPQAQPGSAATLPTDPSISSIRD